MLRSSYHAMNGPTVPHIKHIPIQPALNKSEQIKPKSILYLNGKYLLSRLSENPIVYRQTLEYLYQIDFNYPICNDENNIHQFSLTAPTEGMLKGGLNENKVLSINQ